MLRFGIIFFMLFLFVKIVKVEEDVIVVFNKFKFWGWFVVNGIFYFDFLLYIIFCGLFINIGVVF